MRLLARLRRGEVAPGGLQLRLLGAQRRGQGLVLPLCAFLRGLRLCRQLRHPQLQAIQLRLPRLEPAGGAGTHDMNIVIHSEEERRLGLGNPLVCVTSTAFARAEGAFCKNAALLPSP